MKIKFVIISLSIVCIALAISLEIVVTEKNQLSSKLLSKRADLYDFKRGYKDWQRNTLRVLEEYGLENKNQQIFIPDRQAMVEMGLDKEDFMTVYTPNINPEILARLLPQPQNKSVRLEYSDDLYTAVLTTDVPLRKGTERMEALSHYHESVNDKFILTIRDSTHIEINLINGALWKDVLPKLNVIFNKDA